MRSGRRDPAADQGRKERPTFPNVLIPAADGIEGAADHLERDIPAADQDRRNGNTY